jgi:tight adherence protein B
MTVTTFVILFVAMKPSAERKALGERIANIQTAVGQTSASASGLLLAEADDSFAWLHKIAEHFKFSEMLQLLILQSDTNMTVGKFMMGSSVCAAVFGLAGYLLLDNAVLTLILAAQATFYPLIFLTIKKNRRVKAFNAGLADSIDMMARALRAGHSLVAAIGIVAEQAVQPVRSEFDEVFKQQNYGLPLREALMQLLDRVPSQDLRVVVTGMLVQKETGGNLAAILDRIADVIRDRIRIHGEIRTHTAQGRLTGYILCALPIVMLVLINWINPGYSDILLKTPTGNKLLYLGMALLVLGGLSIKQIIGSIEV